jgi:hypothetical protein
VMVTGVPPEAGPLTGDTDEMAGGAAAPSSEVAPKALPGNSADKTAAIDAQAHNARVRPPVGRCTKPFFLPPTG